jgi:hypothetical protein
MNSRVALSSTDTESRGRCAREQDHCGASTVHPELDKDDGLTPYGRERLSLRRSGEDTSRHPVAVIRFPAEPDEIAAKMGPAFGQVLAYPSRHAAL